LVLLGSLRAGSINRQLAELAIESAPDGVSLELFDRLGELPFYNEDIDNDDVPASVVALRSAAADADAALVVTPEYNGSIPGVLKNAIDWLIGTGELERKVVAITAAVPAPDRGRFGLQALRQTLGAVSAVIVGGEPVARGPTFEQGVAELVRALVDAARGQRE
jgi:NAD(P)H-dependent FMN reductase